MGRGLTPTANNYIRRETFNTYRGKIGMKPVTDPNIQYHARERTKRVNATKIDSNGVILSHTESNSVY